MNTIICLVFVALIIAVCWLFLYCMWLKNRMRDIERQMLEYTSLRNHTDNSVYALARALGYKRCPTLGFVKESVVIK